MINVTWTNPDDSYSLEVAKFVFGNMPCYPVAIGYDHKIIGFDPRLAEKLGHEPGDRLIGLDFNTVLPDYLHENHPGYVKRYGELGNTVSKALEARDFRAFEFKHADGSKVAARICLKPFSDSFCETFCLNKHDHNRKMVFGFVNLPSDFGEVGQHARLAEELKKYDLLEAVLAMLDGVRETKKNIDQVALPVKTDEPAPVEVVEPVPVPPLQPDEILPEAETEPVPGDQSQPAPTPVPPPNNPPEPAPSPPIVEDKVMSELEAMQAMVDDLEKDL